LDFSKIQNSNTSPILNQDKISRYNYQLRYRNKSFQGKKRRKERETEAASKGIGFIYQYPDLCRIEKKRSNPVMAIPSLAFLSAFVVLCLWTSPVRCLRFDLQSGQIKCISEEIKINAMTVGKYSIVNPTESVPLPESHRVSIKVLINYLFLFLFQVGFAIFSCVGIFLVERDLNFDVELMCWENLIMSTGPL
jgi:hypothetical protein